MATTGFTKNFVVRNGITTGNITLDANSGNITGTNLSVTGVSNLGAVGNVRITGGTSGQAIVTDGLGNLSFANASASSSPAPMPTYVASGDTLTVSANYQGLFGYPITVDGTMVVDGVLVDVNAAVNSLYAPVANVIITGGTSGQYLQTDGTGNLSWAAGGGGGGGSPGGVTTQVQFNDAGSFAGNAGLTFNKTTTTLTANNFVATSTINLGNVSNVTMTGGTNGYVLSTNGSGNLSWVAQSSGNSLTSGTAIATTSGTTIEYTTIPSWVKRVTMLFSAVSTSGSSLPMVQIGSGSFVTTGYPCIGGAVTNTAQGVALYATGFTIRNGTGASGAVYGQMVLTNLTGNTWVCSATMSDTSDNRIIWASGSLSLAGVLDRVRLTTVNGTDTFDAGIVNILYE